MVTIPAGVTVQLGFRVQLGRRVASHDPRLGAIALRALRTELRVGSLGRAVLELSPFTEAPAVGEPVAVELDSGAGLQRVFTGAVSGVEPSALGLRVVVESPLGRLARLEVEASWEGQPVDAVVKALLQQAQLQVGEVDRGPALGAYAVRRGPRAWRHLLTLAELGGLEVWCDAEGRAQVKVPAPPVVARRVHWGVDLLDMSVRAAPLYPDGAEIWGEGAASRSGDTKAHWLPVDLSPMGGRAAVQPADSGLAVRAGTLGQAPLRLRSGALRSQDAAQASATAVATVRAARPLTGWVLVPGAVELGCGDGVQVKGLPAGHALAQVVAAPLRVRGVVHTLDATAGLTTRLEV